MKQNSQWLSQVWMRSNTALVTVAPNGSPGILWISMSIDIPPLSTTRPSSGSSTRRCHSMMSRGATPFTLSTASPTVSPALSAQEPASTAATIGDASTVSMGASGYPRRCH